MTFMAQVVSERGQMNPDLTTPEWAGVLSLMTLFAAAERLGYVRVDPDEVETARALHGYCGDQLKQLWADEQEVFSLAYPVAGGPGGPYLHYRGTLATSGNREEGRLVYRGVDSAADLERVYRQGRYGPLLTRNQALPTEHRLTFEVCPDLPAPNRLMVPGMEGAHPEH